MIHTRYLIDYNFGDDDNKAIEEFKNGRGKNFLDGTKYYCFSSFYSNYPENENMSMYISYGLMPPYFQDWVNELNNTFKFVITILHQDNLPIPIFRKMDEFRNKISYYSGETLYNEIEKAEKLYDSYPILFKIKASDEYNLAGQKAITMMGGILLRLISLCESYVYPDEFPEENNLLDWMIEKHERSLNPESILKVTHDSRPKVHCVYENGLTREKLLLLNEVDLVNEKMLDLVNEKMPNNSIKQTEILTKLLKKEVKVSTGIFHKAEEKFNYEFPANDLYKVKLIIQPYMYSEYAGRKYELTQIPVFGYYFYYAEYTSLDRLAVTGFYYQILKHISKYKYDQHRCVYYKILDSNGMLITILDHKTLYNKLFNNFNLNKFATFLYTLFNKYLKDK